METQSPAPETEFIAALRQTAERFFRAVDEWETAYRKYYRLAEPGGPLSSDMTGPQREFDAARNALNAMVPRARGLCFKYGLRDIWTPLVHSRLGQFAPQDRHSSAISRTERATAFEILILLAEKTGSPLPGEPEPAPRSDSRSPLRRLRDLFF